MKYKVYCVIHAPKNRHIMKEIIVDATCDAEAVKRAEEKFNKYLTRVGYKVEVVIYDPMEPLYV